MIFERFLMGTLNVTANNSFCWLSHRFLFLSILTSMWLLKVDVKRKWCHICRRNFQK